MRTNPIMPNESAPAGDQPLTLLIVEDDQAMRQMCISLFEREGYAAEGASSMAEAYERVINPREKPPVSLVLSDVKLARDGLESGIELLRKIKAVKPELPMLLMTGYANVQDAVEAMKLGAADYVTKPFERAELINKVQAQLKVRALESEVKTLREALEDKFGIKGFIGASAGMRAVCERIEAAGRSMATVLITGESGTGKELVARAIHHKSVRTEKPFVPVNCAAMPEALIESELFGHESGSFTGATKEGIGLFRAAHGGTIFLDEVADMPKDVQAKLLRVLQDKRVRPVGSTKEIPVDVRVIAATNLNIERERAAQGENTLRDDVYFRLSVIRIELPPLRERPGDMPLLIQHFLAKHAKSAGRRMRRIAPNAMDAMLGYAWPGNVRELESAIESAYALGRTDELLPEDLPRQITAATRAPISQGALASEAPPISPFVAAPAVSPQFTPPAIGTLESFKLDALEKDALLRALHAAHGNKSKAAELLGVSRKRLYRMLHDYGFEKDSNEDPA